MMKQLSMMKRGLSGIACALLSFFCATTASAENNPYRSDVVWVTVPDHDDWLYKTNEKANVEIQLYRYGIPQNGATVVYEIGNDMLPSDQKDSVVIKNGKAVIPVGTMKKPGFRDCRMSVKMNGKTYKHHVKVGFSPEKITPYTRKPTDFDSFWENCKKEAARYPLNYTKKYVEQYSNDKVDCYLIQLFLNDKGQSIYGYLSYPKNASAGSCPAVLCPPGAGIKTIKDPMRHKYYAENGFIRFEMEIHGLNPEIPEETFREISRAFNGKENGYLTNGIDNRDNYYMKRVYMACLRAVDLLTSLRAWDGRNMAVQGGSQGGGLALVTAGLDPRVTLCVANHPALSDMAAYQEKETTGGYPHFFRTEGMDTPEKLNTMPYFDVVNFARNITIPTYMTWGFNDDVCPPTTSYAVYNTLNEPKEALITPINEHWASQETSYGQMLWIKKHLK